MAGCREAENLDIRLQNQPTPFRAPSQFKAAYDLQRFVGAERVKPILLGTVADNDIISHLGKGCE